MLQTQNAYKKKKNSLNQLNQKCFSYIFFH